MSKVTWHKSAAKDVRPFFGAASLESALANAEIRLFEESTYSHDTAFTIEPHSAEKLCISIRHNVDAKLLATGSVKKSDLLLAVTAAQPFLKKTCVVSAIKASNGLPEEIAIGDEVLFQLGGGSPLNVDVALCLGRRLPKNPGSPFLFGHWISKKRFSIKQPTLAEEFNIVAIDDEGWKQMGLPAKTLYFVDYFGGFNEPTSKDKQVARVLVHSDMHKKLSLESNQRLAKPIMATLAAEIACQLLACSYSEWEAADEVAPQSPLSAFMKRVSKVHPCSFDQLKQLVQQTGMQKLRAILHADQQSVRAIAEA